MPAADSFCDCGILGTLQRIYKCKGYERVGLLVRCCWLVVDWLIVWLID